MRKGYIYTIILGISIVGVLYGIFDLLNSYYSIEDDMSAASQNEIKDDYENEEFIPTAVEEKKVSPNANFALKKYYDECGHFDYEEAELPKELVNLTRQEVEDYYENWEIEEFEDNNLVLYKEINGYCDNHFVIKLDNDIVKVYRMNTLGELIEYKNTDIVRDYLPKEDAKNLEEGIVIYGEGKLSSALEDYE